MEAQGPQASGNGQVLAAIEACSGALRALEVAIAAARGEGEEEHRQHLTRASGLLREAISELRLSDGRETDVLVHGFVTAPESACGFEPFD
jgi:hypothetical protein